jgi:hypothetical protein
MIRLPASAALCGSAVLSIVRSVGGLPHLSAFGPQERRQL